jgi:hypothetical protein
MLRRVGPELPRPWGSPLRREEFNAADLNEPDLDERTGPAVSSGSSARSAIPPAAPGSPSPVPARPIAVAPTRAQVRQRRRSPSTPLPPGWRRVIIERKPAVEVIARFGADPHAALYVDPPYLAYVRSMRTKRGDRAVREGEQTEEQKHGTRWPRRVTIVRTRGSSTGVASKRDWAAVTGKGNGVVALKHRDAGWQNPRFRREGG